MDFTVQNVYGLLLRSRLMPIDHAKKMFERWNQEAGEHSKNVARFARWMVEKRYLTEYQATLLARGYADGFILGRYTILERLGKGRMAGVYRARHEKGAIVAIKVLPPSKARDPDLLQRFHREARLAMKLKHPNVVRTFDVGKSQSTHEEDPVYYLVMEHLEGETLEDLLKRKKKFSPPEAVGLIYQALLGLQHIHENGLIHRDLKPANMMLAQVKGKDGKPTGQVTVKILDLGLSRTFAEESGDLQESTANSALTQEGIVLGTPDYMSPEQARNARAADIRSDIYGLGCVLFHLLSGEPPFPDTNIISQMIRHSTETPRRLKELNPEVADGLQQVIDWMMAKDPAKRYPTPGRAAKALEVFLAAGGNRPQSSPELDPSMQPYLQWLADNVEKGTGEMKAAQVPKDKPKKQAKPKAAKTVKRKKADAAALPVDVELVPLNELEPPEQELFSFPLSPRDLVMCGAGIAIVLIGAGVGLLSAMIFGAFR